MIRVQIPAYHDRWMMGDRFGTLMKTAVAKRGQLGARAALLTDRRFGEVVVAYVKLDKSGKTVKVILDDCEGIE